MPRPRQTPLRDPLPPSTISAASYLGSREHKARRWWGGLPGARVGRSGIARRPKRQLTTICPLVTASDRLLATFWVQQALTLGHCRFYEGDHTYPKHVWHQDELGQFWFGFCVNGAAGHYKGWPIDEAEKREKFD